MKTIHSKTGVRQLHKATAEKRRKMQLAFLLQDWDDAYNVGGMFRVADACGAYEMVFSGRTPQPPDPMVSVTSLGHHRRVHWRDLGRNEDAAIKLKQEGYTLVAVEIAEGATHYTEFDYPEKTCLVLGNEVKGVYGSVMKHCDACVFIPMAGKGRSLNVHVAGSVIAFQALDGVRSEPEEESE